MKWQHWLGWALLAVCVVVLGVYVFWDKPAEARSQMYRCSASMSVGAGVIIYVACPDIDSSAQERLAVVNMVTPELETTEQWSGRLRRVH